MDTFKPAALTACGECCTGCAKKQSGACPGCIEADGRVPEWAGSGRCRIHACTRKHGVTFCGLCPDFPCGDLEKLIDLVFLLCCDERKGKSRFPHHIHKTGLPKRKLRQPFICSVDQ